MLSRISFEFRSQILLLIALRSMKYDREVTGKHVGVVVGVVTIRFKVMLKVLTPGRLDNVNILEELHASTIATSVN